MIPPNKNPPYSLPLSADRFVYCIFNNRLPYAKGLIESNSIDNHETNNLIILSLFLTKTTFEYQLKPYRWLLPKNNFWFNKKINNL